MEASERARVRLGTGHRLRAGLIDCEGPAPQGVV